MSAIQVVPRGKKWAVRVAGASKAEKIFANKAAAAGFAKMSPVRPIYIFDATERIAEVIRE